MAETLIEITEGWSAPLEPFTLRADGEPVDLSGMTVELVAHDVNGAEVAIEGEVEPDSDQDENPGQVSFTPAADDFSAALSPYTVHFKVTDGDGKVAFFPNGRAYELRVRPQ